VAGSSWRWRRYFEAVAVEVLRLADHDQPPAIGQPVQQLIGHREPRAAPGRAGHRDEQPVGDQPHRQPGLERERDHLLLAARERVLDRERLPQPRRADDRAHRLALDQIRDHSAGQQQIPRRQNRSIAETEVMPDHDPASSRADGGIGLFS
jgi:hypothetical protein